MQGQSSVFGGCGDQFGTALHWQTGERLGRAGGGDEVARTAWGAASLGGRAAQRRTSPNQIPVVDVVLAFFAGVLTGSRRFALNYAWT